MQLCHIPRSSIRPFIQHKMGELVPENRWYMHRRHAVNVPQGRVAFPRPAAMIKKLTTGCVTQWQLLVRTVAHGQTGFNRLCPVR